MTPRAAIPGAQRAEGFTLLEVVLSLVIFSLITLMVYGAFYTGHRAVLKGERAAEINQRIRLVEEIVSRQIRSTVYYYARHEDDRLPYFMGKPDGMSFISAAPQSRGGTGLVVVTYRVVDGQLVLEERSAFTPDDLYDPPSDTQVRQAVLLAGFSTIQFEYLPHEDDDVWHAVWDGREDEALPAAVRVTVGGLEFFSFHPWVQEIPIMTIAYGWGTDEYQDPPDEDDDDNEGPGATGEDDDEDDDDEDDDEGDA